MCVWVCMHVHTHTHTCTCVIVCLSLGWLWALSFGDILIIGWLRARSECSVTSAYSMEAWHFPRIRSDCKTVDSEWRILVCNSSRLRSRILLYGVVLIRSCFSTGSGLVYEIIFRLPGWLPQYHRFNNSISHSQAKHSNWLFFSLCWW